MYQFKQELNLDFRNRKKASEEIGIHHNTLGLILRGDLTCSKVTAYCITKLLYRDAEIEDFFVKVEKEEQYEKGKES